MRLFRKTKPTDSLKVRIVDRPVTHLRADEFRADRELVHLAATVLANPNFQLLLSVLRNEHPGFEVLGPSASVNDRIVVQSRAEGWTMALATLESLGTRATLPERLVSTFGAVDTQNAESAG
jgi:hypothetical protein